MKKILLAMAFLVSTLSAGELMIKRDSGKVSLSFEKDASGSYILSNKKKFDDRVKVIIVYEDDSAREAIESKYDILSNGKDMYGMYFIYEQNSDDIVDLFSKLSEEKKIKRVYPNWTMNIKKY